jgi:hypothetical protein
MALSCGQRRRCDEVFEMFASEELVAELASAFLCADLDLQQDAREKTPRGYATPVSGTRLVRDCVRLQGKFTVRTVRGTQPVPVNLGTALAATICLPMRAYGPGFFTTQR